MDNDGRDDSGWSEQPLSNLSRLVDLATALDVDSMLISGDYFDHNRIDTRLAAITAGLLGRAAIPVVVLPGNHDPYTADSVYRRHQFPDNVRILREATGELLLLPEVGIQVWGQAHTDYLDFAPLAAPPAWRDQSDNPLWRVAIAHGLYVRSDYETRLSYRIHAGELASLGAHYIGLGHLEHHEQIREFAYYAGAPNRTGGATLIDLAPSGVSVRHADFAQQ
jgi:DNA repair protein SbcD/Mre11